MPIDPLVHRLSQLDTCAVSDALDRLGISGVAFGIRPQWQCPRIAGRAVTVKIVAADGSTSKRHLGTAAIEAATENDVIVIEHHSRDDAAGWGGILSTAAKTKGVRGVVIDGSSRDIDEAREVGFPLYARNAVPVTARGRVVEKSFNEPITMGGNPVNPGDLVLADGSGVVFIPAERAETVLQAAEEIAAKEAAMREAVLAGRSVVEVMGANYESMLTSDR